MFLCISWEFDHFDTSCSMSSISLREDLVRMEMVKPRAWKISKKISKESICFEMFWKLCRKSLLFLVNDSSNQNSQMLDCIYLWVNWLNLFSARFSQVFALAVDGPIRGIPYPLLSSCLLVINFLNFAHLSWSPFWEDLDFQELYAVDSTHRFFPAFWSAL